MINIKVFINKTQIQAIIDMMDITNTMIGCSAAGEDGLPFWDENVTKNNKKIKRFLKYNKLIK